MMTPILLQQFRLYYDSGAGPDASGHPEGPEKSPDCGPTAGGQPKGQATSQFRAVEAIAPFGNTEAMIAELKAKVFPGRELLTLVTTAAGKEVV